MRALLLLIAGLISCSEPIREDATGSIGVMHFEAVQDDCLPKRFTGTTGRLFLGRTDKGRTIVVSSYESFWGPPRERNGVIEPGSRSDFVTGSDVELVLGSDPSRRCTRLRYRWSDLGSADGGQLLELKQSWEIVDPGCPEALPQLPERDCGSVRRVRFVPEQTCRLQCLPPASADFTCGC